jgi:hypothetical protein
MGRRHWILAISIFCLAIIIPEITLRIVGFHYYSAVPYGPLRSQFMTYFESDKDLLWHRDIVLARARYWLRNIAGHFSRMRHLSILDGMTTG